MTDSKWDLWQRAGEMKNADGCANIIMELAIQLGCNHPSEQTTKLWTNAVLMSAYGANFVQMMSDHDFKAQHDKLKKQWVQLKEGVKFDEELEMLPDTAAELRDMHANVYNRAFLGGGPVLCKLDLIKLDALCRQRVCRGSGSKQFGSGLLSTPNVQQHGQALAMNPLSR